MELDLYNRIHEDVIEHLTDHSPEVLNHVEIIYNILNIKYTRISRNTLAYCEAVNNRFHRLGIASNICLVYNEIKKVHHLVVAIGDDLIFDIDQPKPVKDGFDNENLSHYQLLCYTYQVGDPWIFS